MNNNSKRGFTLVETLVAISIFSAAILGLLGALSQSITSTGYAKTKILATYLAQEGIEYMRNMRDTFVLFDAAGSQNGWNRFNSKILTSLCQGANGCYFDDQNIDYANHTEPMTGITLLACNSSCPALLYDAATGKYGYTSGANSGFIRKITIETSPDQVKILSKVSWKQNSGDYTITFSENLFNWVQEIENV